MFKTPDGYYSKEVMKVMDNIDIRDNAVLGWIGFDDNAPTRDVAQLREIDNQLVVTVLYQSDCGGVADWFQRKKRNIDKEDLPATAVGVPQCFWIYDDSSKVKHYILVDCENRGSSWTSRYQTGRGHIAPRYVVMGEPGFDYSKMNSLRSTMPLLTGWSGLAGLESRFNDDEESPLENYSAWFANGNPLKIDFCDSNIMLRLVPTKTVTPNTVQRINLSLTAEVECITTSQEPISLEDHMRIHDELRLLMGISCWKESGYSSIEIQRNDDFFTLPEGKELPPFWRRIISCSYPRQGLLEDRPTYLFRLDDIGVSGLEEWFELRKEYSEGLDEIVYLSWSHNQIIPSARIVLFGVAFDAIGFALSKGSGKKVRSIKERTKLVLSEMGQLGNLLIGDPEKFASDMAETYNCIKHADHKAGSEARRECLDFNHMIEIDIACELIFRAWIAKRIGCSIDTLTNRLQMDPRLKMTQSRWC